MKTLEKASSTALRMKLETACLITYLGGETAGLAIVRRTLRDFKKNSRQAAYVFYWNGLYTEALDYFLKDVEIKDFAITESERFDYYTKIVYAASCYSHLGNRAKALQLYERAIEFSKISLLQAIASTGLATHYLLFEQHLEAMKQAERALDEFKDFPNTYPPVLEAKLTYAHCLILSGNFQSAEAEVDQLLKIFSASGVGPHFRLEYLFLRGLLDFKRTPRFPHAWALLIVYPQSKPHPRTQAMSQYCRIPSVISIGNASPDPSEERIHYDLVSNVVQKIKDGVTTHQLGINLFDRAVIALSSAQEWGISQYRLYDVLWPDDISMDQSKRRIAQLIRRLRQSGLEISWHNAQITLLNREKISCAWAAQPFIEGWCFLKQHPSFHRTDLEKFFSLSKTASIDVCNLWISKNAIRRVKRGKGIFYEVISFRK